MDHMRQQNADLSGIELLVLDEADRMMDMASGPTCAASLRRCRRRSAGRQTLLFSATMRTRWCATRSKSPATRNTCRSGQRSAPPKSITHRVESVAHSHKVEWLIDHLRRPAGPVLIFTRTKSAPTGSPASWPRAGVRCTALHADRSQDQRRIAVEGFKSGKYKVLVATDIAARASTSTRFTRSSITKFPDSADTYVHRVGRTGRADEVGQASRSSRQRERRALAFLAKSVGLPLMRSDA